MKRALDVVIAALAGFDGRKIDLLVGEPCFGPPREIVEAFERAAGEIVPGYGPPAGLPELRTILAEWTGGSDVDAGNVVVTHGAKGGLLALFAALVEPGDEVIHPLPCYPAYPAMVRRLGGVPVGVAEGEGFTGWSDAVVKAMSERTRLVVLSSPSNPSGSILGDGELAGLLALCETHGARMILDEAYEAFRFGGGRFDTDADPSFDTLIRVGSASKSLAVPGWRMGWVMADPGLVAAVTETQAALLNPPAGPPQRALLALPEVPEAFFDRNRESVRGRIDTLAEAIRHVGFEVSPPSGGFYLWIDVRGRFGDETAAHWCQSLAEDHGIGFWPGEDYGCPGFVRLALPQGDDWRDDVAELERRLLKRG